MKNNGEYYSTLLKIIFIGGNLMFINGVYYQDFSVPFASITKGNAQTANSQIQSSPIYGGGTGVNAGPNGRFIGSLSYWQNELNTNYSYNTIFNLVKAVNAANVTRVSGAEMQIIADRIINNYKTKQDLKTALSQNPFYINGSVRDVKQNHILCVIATPIKMNNGNYRCNLSFASKLCQFASKILNAGYEYSKYDSVVSSHLPIYVNEYLCVQLDEKHFSMNGKDIDEKMKTYAEYCEYIGKIIAKVNQGITREEFDHIVWYTNK